jgi:NADH-quinone oxidoreductase subunit L
MQNLTWLILALPLAGFVTLGLCGRVLPRWLIALIGCGVVFGAFVAAVVDFISMLGKSGQALVPDTTFWTWLTSGGLTIKFGLLSDPLSAMMLLVVTGVGFLIHVYSIGYMEGDPGYWRFFAFMNLFVFAMALLVAADNFLFLLVGWGGVGLASFLLIGFWYTRPAAVAAARKAFVVNVIGDVGMMLAIFLLFKTFGSLAYADIFSKQLEVSAGTPRIIIVGPASLRAQIVLMSPVTLAAITLLLFVAAAAKSAQLPLHVWLPDAMEGPTPVSALIHAATMVTAGVYLVARCAPLFSAAPFALGVVGVVTGLTALMAASIACVQTDIKRVLAYSTMSQLGYMFMAESAGSFSAGMFHLTTHAFFKALLFLSAGAVIHALGGEQDMRKMGGLRHRLPLTFWCFVAGGLALAAIFPFAGFWSKDAVLGSLLARGLENQGEPLWLALYAVGLLTAGLTGFYTFRLILGIFWGEYRGGEIASAHGAEAAVSRPSAAGNGKTRHDPLARVREGSRAMSVPMLVLLVLSVIGGAYGLPWLNALGGFLQPVTGAAVELATSNPLLYVNMAAGLLAALAGIGLAWRAYGARAASFVPSRNPLVVAAEHRYYIDDLYDAVFVRPVVWLSVQLRRGIEGVALDGGTRGAGSFVGWTSGVLRSLQTGYARNYALLLFLGAAAILVYYVIR